MTCQSITRCISTVFVTPFDDERLINSQLGWWEKDARWTKCTCREDTMIV